MNLGEMKAELSMIIEDARLEPLLTGWINNAILEVANDYDLPPLRLVDPLEFGVDTSKWLWALPDNFHKNLVHCRWLDTDGKLRHVHVHSHINRLEQRNHTVTGDHVRDVAVAVQGNDHYLGIHPLATDTLELWYYRKPTVLVKDANVCDCIPPGFEARVIYPKLIIKNYQFIVDQVVDFPIVQGPFQYWQGELNRGLFGGRGLSIGLIPYFIKNYDPPRIRGGRDPMGWRPYRYGSF